MLLQYKRGDLEDLIVGEHDLYNTFSLIADKLRVVYGALGWTEAVDDLVKTDNLVEELTQDVLEGLLNDKEEYFCASGGLEVVGYWDEENLCLDYNFRLI